MDFKIFSILVYMILNGKGHLTVDYMRVAMFIFLVYIIALFCFVSYSGGELQGI